MKLKIGIMLPKSDMYPTLAMDFLNGFKLASKKHMPKGIKLKYIIESIGNASDDKPLKIAEKLLLQENVDVTISFCSIFNLKELVTLFNGYKKPLIHIDLGANILKKEHYSPYVLHHTLNLWQSAYTSGVYAANTIGKKAVFASSFYDGGYQHTYALAKAFENEGGTILKYYVAPSDYKNETFDNLIDTINTLKPDVIFTLFSYNEGKKVFNALANSKINGAIPILAFPAMTDETINTEDYNIENVQSIASWAFDQPLENMETFLKKYNKKHKEVPNVFGLMGYEVGITLANCISPKGKINANFTEQLHLKKMMTPRGAIQYNELNESEPENYKLRAFKFNKTEYHNTLIETIKPSNLDELNKEFSNINYTGWQNPYLCT